MPLAVPILQTTLADRRPDRQGKVRDIYEFGDRLLIVAPTILPPAPCRLRHSRQGKVLTRFRRSVRAREPIVPITFCRPRLPRIRAKRGERPICCRGGRCSSPAPNRCRWNASPAATCRARAGKTTSRPVSCAASACPRDWPNRIACPNRSSRRRPRRRAGTTSTSRKRTPPNWSTSACSIASRS